MLREKNKGITLVALVITIVILLILAGISISTLTNTGIFQKAKDAKKASENAEKEQRETLGEYEKELNKYIAQELTENKINTVLSKTENTVLEDKNGNVFTLPAGFKVVVNDDTGNAKTVDKGIVIEDATVDGNGNATPTNGSQFVWVPVGDIKKEDGNIVEIGLNRYTFEEDGTPTAKNNEVINLYYSETASKGNTVAKNITNFTNSVNANGGYYIGRYEARTTTARNDKGNALTQITEKGTDQVYNYVKQQQAAQLAQEMYTSNNFTSDLMNSYAWDTATLFLQSCGTNKKYSRQSSLNTSRLQTGTNSLTEINKIDKQCNVYDMSSNVLEWTTEKSSNSGFSCVNRGGYCNNNSYYTSFRNYDYTSNSTDLIGFRSLLYVND